MTAARDAMSAQSADLPEVSPEDVSHIFAPGGLPARIAAARESRERILAARSVARSPLILPQTPKVYPDPPADVAGPATEPPSPRTAEPHEAISPSPAARAQGKGDAFPRSSADCPAASEPHHRQAASDAGNGTIESIRVRQRPVPGQHSSGTPMAVRARRGVDILPPLPPADPVGSPGPAIHRQPGPRGRAVGALSIFAAGVVAGISLASLYHQTLFQRPPTLVEKPQSSELPERPDAIPVLGMSVGGTQLAGAGPVLSFTRGADAADGVGASRMGMADDVALTASSVVEGLP